MRLAPSATSSSSVVDNSASAPSSTCTLNIGVPSSPAFHRQRFFDLFKEEGTPRPRSGGASTSSGYNSTFDPERDSALPWLYGIARNTLRGHWRRLSRS